MRPTSQLARALAIVLAAAVTLTAGRSFAGDETANSLINSGVEHYKHHDYELARIDFERAYSLDPQSGTLFNLALAELQSGHPLDAARHLRAYLLSPEVPPERRESVRARWLRQAEAQIGRVSVEAPPGAQVLLDGFVQGEVPFAEPLDVTAGDHEVEARLGSWSRSVHVSALLGVVTTVHFEVVQLPSPTSPPPSAIVPSSITPAATEAPRPAGIPAAKIATVAVLGGAAVIATGVAVGFTVASHDAYNHANTLRAGLTSTSECAPGQQSLPPICPELASAISSQSNEYHLSVGLYVVGGVLAGAGLVTWLIWPRPVSKSAWSFRPTIDAHGGGAMVMGSF